MKENVTDTTKEATTREESPELDTRPGPDLHLAPVADPAPQDDDSNLVIVFKKPYRFEGKTYTQVDLSGMDNLTAENMIDASNYLTRKGNIAPTPEMNIEYACYIASVAADLPVEFFRQLPVREAVKVKNRVTSFFFGED